MSNSGNHVVANVEIPLAVTNNSTITNINKLVDFHHSLYLHSYDLPGVQIVSEQLVSIKNYPLRKNDMEIVILGKNKISFIDGYEKIRNYHNHWHK